MSLEKRKNSSLVLSHKCFCSKETLEEHLAQDAPRVFLCYKNTYAREDYREYSGSIPGRNQSLERASCLRRKRDYVVAPEFIGGPTSLPTGNRAPSGAVIFSRISVFVSKKHSRSILRKMLLECFFDTKTLMREKITAPEGARFPVGRLVARLLPERCLVRRDVIPLAT